MKIAIIDDYQDAFRTLSSYPKLSSEYIIASNPSLIVLADTVCCGQTAATVAARPGWNTISAVRIAVTTSGTASRV